MTGIVVRSVAAEPFELRRIVVVQGIQYNNKDMFFKIKSKADDSEQQIDERVPEALQKRMKDEKGLDLDIFSKGRSAQFLSKDQGVKFAIRVVDTKDELKAALQSDKTHHVIYLGHSRYGRGCCFGTNTKPGEDWEDGSSPGLTGLFRMGFPYVGVPLHEIGEHFYTANLVPVSEKLPKADCEPDLRGALSGLKPHTRAQCETIYRGMVDGEEKAAQKKEEALRKKLDRELNPNEKIRRVLQPDVSKVMGKLHLNGSPVNASDKFWCTSLPGEGFSLVLHAGWENTVSAPMDLGATEMKCRVFCHFGCSSQRHFRPIVVDHKNFKQVDDTDQFSFFTSNLAAGFTVTMWLFHLLTFPKYNAFKPWKESLEYARANTNDEIPPRTALWNSIFTEKNAHEGFVNFKIVPPPSASKKK